MMNQEITMLTLWQPWATLVALGIKQVETRHWATNYRGLIAIHAAKRKVDADGHDLIARLGSLIPEGTVFPFGAITSVATLKDCKQMVEDDEVEEETPYICVKFPDRIFYPSLTERDCGLWEAGRYAWFLENNQPIEPIYCKGMQGLPRITDSLILTAINQRIKS